MIQFLEQRLGLLQVFCSKPLGEPVNWLQVLQNEQTSVMIRA